MPRAKSGLTEKQERFVEEYLIDLNATQAAIRAGYSKKTARFQASALLANPNVYARVREEKEKRGVRTGVDQDYVIAGILNEIEVSRELGQMTAAIKGWELLSKHTGGFTDELKLSGKVDFASILKQMRDAKSGNKS